MVKKEKLIPDVIISSSAIRACDIAKAVAKACGYKGEIILSRSLYAAEPKAYFKALCHIQDKHVRVLVFGHNPGIEELVEILTGEDHIMPTCSLAYLELQINSWSNIIEEDYQTTKG